MLWSKPALLVLLLIMVKAVKQIWILEKRERVRDVNKEKREEDEWAAVIGVRLFWRQMRVELTSWASSTN